ncbi:hypothetical protein Tco_0475504 [Tanacetum coccineum]
MSKKPNESMVKHGDNQKGDDHGETSNSKNKQELVAHVDDSLYYDCQTPTSDDHKIPSPTLPSPPRKSVHKRRRRSSDDGTTAEFFEKTRRGEGMYEKSITPEIKKGLLVVGRRVFRPNGTTKVLGRDIKLPNRHYDGAKKTAKFYPDVGLLLWMKFHDVPLDAYTSDGLNLMTTKIGTLMMLVSCTDSMCLESRGQRSYARILIEIYACNDFSDNLVMIVPNLEGNGYAKETIRIEYEWERPRCSTCLIFGHSPVNCR